MKTAGPPLPVKRGEGPFLELEDGRRLVDCISSWWVTLHGHGCPEIADAIYQQALKLEHVIFAGFTHEPAVRLSQELAKVLPSGLTRVFFSDNGSTSVEVALKMAFQYWKNIGVEGRTRFIGFEGGYHGDTLGAMSAGGSSVFWDHYRPLMFDIDTVPFPATHDHDDRRAQKEQASLNALRALLAESDKYAAIIIEPLVQGAAGMHMCSTEFLRSLKAVAAEYNVLLIFDEVMTGFGRTGDWFATTKASVTPDIICLSKGITGGTLPLSVTYCSERIYEAFLDDKLEKALFHSHSYTGNPIACAAALASLELLHKNQNAFRQMETIHRELVRTYISGSPHVSNTRFCGTIAAFDFNAGDQNHYFNATAPQLRARFLEAGLLLRPLGNTIYLMPPLCISEDTLQEVYEKIAAVISGT